MYLLREWSFLLFLACLAVSSWSFFRIVSVTRHYRNAINSRKKTAAEIAGDVLAESGIKDVVVSKHPGESTDHYSPSEKSLHLSSVVYDSVR
jgi:Zn-dependent membrane protease YugP